ncbi:hypothetical protein CRG98_024227 [Punica granatum]|uniref:Uncharacterized protein n=1 Tax=Punica granatum TaxID=22663 RepID=A0A2I0JIE2_PUNGR|nr:hypothetical protein CRG98_024227 [Punica granatum]
MQQHSGDAAAQHNRDAKQQSRDSAAQQRRSSTAQHSTTQHIHSSRGAQINPKTKFDQEAVEEPRGNRLDREGSSSRGAAELEEEQQRVQQQQGSSGIGRRTAASPRRGDENIFQLKGFSCAKWVNRKWLNRYGIASWVGESWNRSDPDDSTIRPKARKIGRPIHLVGSDFGPPPHLSLLCSRTSQNHSPSWRRTAQLSTDLQP